MSDLSGQIALVTGGSRGIGRAIVDRLGAAGATVATCGRGDRPTDLPQNVLWVQADVAAPDQAAQLVSTVRDALGAVSILVNNAGIQIEKTVADTTDADWDSLIGINCRGVFNMSRAFIPQVPASGGRIVNLGSISGKTADPAMAIYNASKGFVHALTRSIAIDHGPSIRCNAVCPGWIMTAMAEAGFAAARDPALAQKDALARHASGRFGRPEDVAETVLWLVSDASNFMTGQCLTLDGGLTAASPLQPGLF